MLSFETVSVHHPALPPFPYFATILQTQPAAIIIEKFENCCPRSWHDNFMLNEEVYAALQQYHHDVSFLVFDALGTVYASGYHRWSSSISAALALKLSVSVELLKCGNDCLLLTCSFSIADKTKYALASCGCASCHERICPRVFKNYGKLSKNWCASSSSWWIAGSRWKWANRTITLEPTLLEEWTKCSLCAAGMDQLGNWHVFKWDIALEAYTSARLIWGSLLSICTAN